MICGAREAVIMVLVAAEKAQGIDMPVEKLTVRGST